MAFLSTPVTYILMRFCLFLEWTGLCQGAWVVALVHRKIVKFHRDEVYIGTAEERAAKKKANGADPRSMDETDYNVKPGHMFPGVPRLPVDFGHRMQTLEDIDELEAELNQHKLEVEHRIKLLQEKKAKLQTASAVVATDLAESSEASEKVEVHEDSA